MSKYSKVAIAAAGKARNGLNPVKAWAKQPMRYFRSNQQVGTRDVRSALFWDCQRKA